MDTTTIVALYRFANPKSRVQDLFRYYWNTSARKNVECVICGTQGPTWCSRWPKTQTAIDWEIAHYSKHKAQFEAKEGVK